MHVPGMPSDHQEKHHSRKDEGEHTATYIRGRFYSRMELVISFDIDH